VNKLKLKNQLSCRGLVIIFILAVVIILASSRISCQAQFWQPTLKLEKNDAGIQQGFVVELPEAAGEPKLEFNRNVFRIDNSDYYQIGFSAKTLPGAQWFRLGMGGYQEDKLKHENYDPESDLYLSLGYDRKRKEEGFDILGELRFFISTSDFGWQVDRASYLSRQDNISLGLSSTWINDKYLNRLGYGPMIKLEKSDYQISLEYFFGDIDWRLEGSYNF
jgi:hypothetical protein